MKKPIRYLIRWSPWDAGEIRNEIVNRDDVIEVVKEWARQGGRGFEAFIDTEIKVDVDVQIEGVNLPSNASGTPHGS